MELPERDAPGTGICANRDPLGAGESYRGRREAGREAAALCPDRMSPPLSDPLPVPVRQLPTPWRVSRSQDHPPADSRREVRPATQALLGGQGFHRLEVPGDMEDGQWGCHVTSAAPLTRRFLFLLFF